MKWERISRDIIDPTASWCPCIENIGLPGVAKHFVELIFKENAKPGASNIFMLSA